MKHLFYSIIFASGLSLASCSSPGPVKPAGALGVVMGEDVEAPAPPAEREYQDMPVLQHSEQGKARTLLQMNY